MIGRTRRDIGIGNRRLNAYLGISTWIDYINVGFVFLPGGGEI